MSENKMDPVLKAAWLADLKSGRYPKTVSHLKDDTGYCCLGVLCETAKVGFPEKPGLRTISMGEWYPCEVEGEAVNRGNELSGFGLKRFGISRLHHDKLTEINDSTDTFDDVIEYIEDNL